MFVNLSKQKFPNSKCLFRNEFDFAVPRTPDSLRNASLQLFIRPNEFSLDQTDRINLGSFGLAHRRFRSLPKESFCHCLI